jgi:hypothetical protein
MQAMTLCRCLRLLDYRQVTQPIGVAQQYASGIEGGFGVTATRINPTSTWPTKDVLLICNP